MGEEDEVVTEPMEYTCGDGFGGSVRRICFEGRLKTELGEIRSTGETEDLAARRTLWRAFNTFRTKLVMLLGEIEALKKRQDSHKDIFAKMAKPLPHRYVQGPTSWGSGCYQSLWFYDPKTGDVPQSVKCGRDHRDAIHGAAK